MATKGKPEVSIIGQAPMSDAARRLGPIRERRCVVAGGGITSQNGGRLRIARRKKLRISARL